MAKKNMTRNDVYNELQKFAIDIKATQNKNYLLSQKVLGMGKAIELMDKAIRETLGKKETTPEWKKYLSLVFQINMNYKGV